MTARMGSWEIAKAGKPDLGWEDHGIFCLHVPLDFGGAGQDIQVSLSFHPPSVNNHVYSATAMEFIGRLMQAFGVSQFSAIEGRTAFVGRRNGFVRGVKPLPTEKGVEFDFDDFNLSDWFFGAGRVVDRNGDVLNAAALSL